MVGLGSGDTYERHRKVLDAVKGEPDDPLLITDMERGDWTIHHPPPGA